MNLRRILQEYLTSLPWAQKAYLRLRTRWRKRRYALYRFHRRRRQGYPQKIVSSDIINLCMNCGQSFCGKYCPQCGQNHPTRRLSLTSFLESLMGGITNISRGFGFTILGLFTRPGYLIHDFIRGKRVLYTKPFQMLFVLATAYALLFHLLYPEEIERDKQQKEKQDIALVDAAKNEELRKPKKHEQRRQEIISWREAGKIDSTTARIALQEGRVDSTEKRIIDDKARQLLLENKLTESEVRLLLVRRTLNKDKELAINEKFQDLTHSSFFSRLSKLLDRWKDNRAFTAILFLPFIALGTKWSFRKSKANPRLNFIECLFACAYVSLQGLILSIFFLPFPLANYEDHSIWVQGALGLWTYKELFRFPLWSTFWRFVLSYTYAIFAIVLLACAMVGIVAWLA